MRRPLIAGNWKLNGSSSGARSLASEIASQAPSVDVDMLICPSFTLLGVIGEAIEQSGVALGAQNVAAQEQGAFTGEVSARMLSEAGCRYVIIGHSERRSLFAERDDQLAQKMALSLAAGLTPVLCVGESLEERDAGRVLEVVQTQLEGGFASVTDGQLGDCVLAYEPVWAIGTGRSASPEQAQEVHAAMRAWVASRDATAAGSMRQLSGGSVKADNAKALFAQADIDGALVGGASLVTNDFLAIARAAAE